jgi:hypothetical protein
MWHQINRHEIPLERAHAIVDPVVLARVVVPEMLVRVDNHGSGIGVPPPALEM